MVALNNGIFGKVVRPDGDRDVCNTHVYGDDMHLCATMEALHPELAAYFYRWYFDRPIIVTPNRNAELRRIAELLARCHAYYASHYEDFLDVIPYDDDVLEILGFVKDQPYRLGPARPDYVIAEDGGIKVCEVTSRFYGNGYYLSFFADKRGRELADRLGIPVVGDLMERMLDHLVASFGKHRRLSLIKSADRNVDIKIYIPFLRACGFDLKVYEYEEILPHRHELEGTYVISALNQKDLLSLPKDLLHRILSGDYTNDMRTVFLAHDKRFLSLLFDDRFTGAFLNASDTAFLREHVVQTYVHGRSPEFWEDARKHKDGYIVKPARLGKSEGVHAGCITDAATWESLWTSGAIEDMILQPFIQQRTFPNKWEGKHFDEYVCGLILAIDGQYFGTGIFRASSSPVINQTDDRKAAMLVVGEDVAADPRVIVL